MKIFELLENSLFSFFKFHYFILSLSSSCSVTFFLCIALSLSVSLSFTFPLFLLLPLSSLCFFFFLLHFLFHSHPFPFLLLCFISSYFCNSLSLSSYYSLLFTYTSPWLSSVSLSSVSLFDLFSPFSVYHLPVFRFFCFSSSFFMYAQIYSSF